MFYHRMRLNNLRCHTTCPTHLRQDHIDNQNGIFSFSDCVPNCCELGNNETVGESSALRREQIAK